MIPAVFLACAALASPAPELVGPGVISDAATVYNTAFTPDGRTLVMTRVRPEGDAEIVSYALEGDAWVPSDYFRGALRGRDAGDGSFSPDGRTFLFVEDRDLYVMRRTADAWTTPERLGPAFNTPAFEAYPTLADDGTLCFTRDAAGDWDVYLAPPEGDAWGEPVRLPAPVNTRLREHDALLTPDAGTIIFVRRGDPRGAGATDLFITRRSDAGWSAPEPLPFNSPGIDGSPRLTPDGRWLYFTSSRPAPGDANGTLNIWRVPWAG